jgi:hypothetical protein
MAWVTSALVESGWVTALYFVDGAARCDANPRWKYFEPGAKQEFFIARAVKNGIAPCTVLYIGFLNDSQKLYEKKEVKGTSTKTVWISIWSLR